MIPWLAIGRSQAGLQVAENPRLLLPGGMVPQLDEVLIGEVGRQEGIVVEENSAVCQFDGFHALLRFNSGHDLQESIVAHFSHHLAHFTERSRSTLP